MFFFSGLSWLDQIENMCAIYFLGGCQAVWSWNLVWENEADWGCRKCGQLWEIVTFDLSKLC